MADYYTHFSFALRISGDSQAAWWRKKLKAAAKKEDPASGSTMADFCWKICVWPEEQPHVWFYSEENGNLEQIAKYVQEFLKKFDRHGFFVMTWANACSKARIDAFDGGAAVVTAAGVVWQDREEWVKSLTQRLQSRNTPDL